MKALLPEMESVRHRLHGACGSTGCEWRIGPSHVAFLYFETVIMLRPCLGSEFAGAVDERRADRLYGKGRERVG